jgi:hypothetical protein
MPAHDAAIIADTIEKRGRSAYFALRYNEEAGERLDKQAI